MPNKKIALIALLSAFAAGEIMAGTLTSYSVGDVLVCFRGNAGNDLVVDAGSISTITNYAPNTTNVISTFNSSQLAYVGIDGISWSAFTYFDATVSPNWTLFMTRGRSSLETQSAPWPTASSSSQSFVANDIVGAVRGANDNINFEPENTATAVVEQDSSQGNANYPTGFSYHDTVDPEHLGINNFGGDFAGNPEVTTPDSFDLGNTPVRCDFYQIPPTGAGTVRYLGYFELSPQGALSYVAYPTATPQVSAFSRAGTVASITYKTGTYGTYTLRATNNITAPALTWPAVATLSSGDGKSHTYQDTDSTSTNKFYIITAQ